MTALYLILAVPFTVGGLVFLGIASARRRAARRRRRRATVRAEARIVGRRVRAGGIGSRSAVRCVYEFSAGGIRRQVQYAGKRHMREGDAVEIFYDPDHPDTVYLPGVQTWTANAALLFIGGCWLLGGVMLFICGILGVK